MSDSNGVAMPRSVMCVTVERWGQLAGLRPMLPWHEVTRQFTPAGPGWRSMFDLSWPAYMPKAQAELDEAHRQIIPFGVVTRSKGREVFAYTRGGEEGRLNGLWSIAVGGHVEPGDEQVDISGRFGELVGSLARELREEIGIEFGGFWDFLGFVTDQSTAVGRVHGGMCFHVDMNRFEGEPPPLVLSSETATGRFVTWGQLRTIEKAGGKLEPWGQITRDHLAPGDRLEAARGQATTGGV